MEFVDKINYCMMVLPLGLIVLAIRRLVKGKRVQFAIKDLLFLPWIFLPAVLLSKMHRMQSHSEFNFTVLGISQAAGAFFIWSCSWSEIGSWRRTISMVAGALVTFVLNFSFIFATEFIILLTWHIRSGEGITLLGVVAMNLLALAGFWFLSETNSNAAVIK